MSSIVRSIKAVSASRHPLLVCTTRIDALHIIGALGRHPLKLDPLYLPYCFVEHNVSA
jgi:hypothetical protein